MRVLYPKLLVPTPSWRGRVFAFACLSTVAATFTLAPAVPRAEIVDLRAGTRTSLYGGGFGQGTTDGDFYGWAMAFGDVDGDGFTDFVSSSANAEGPSDEQDHEYDVYLIFGRPHAELDSVYAVDTPGGADIVFYKGGFALACADLDNDGYDDLMLAEEELFVLFGRPRHEFRTVYNFNGDSAAYTPPDIRVIGSSKLGGGVIGLLNLQFDLVARSLVSGDINNDGFADVVFGNHVACDPPGTCVNGAAYIIFGRPRPTFPPVIDVDYRTALPHPDVLVLGDTNERYPTNLAVGDLDGDGVADLVASTMEGWGENNTNPGIGEVHGWWGKREWRAVYDTQIDDFDFSLKGTPDFRGYTLGYRVTTGDLDGDGRDDLIVGSLDGYGSLLPSDRRDAGEYRILFGRPRALWPRWGTAVDMTDVLVLGASGGDALGDLALEWGICFSMATGKHDADAFDDLLIGAGLAHRPDDGTRPGAAYLLRGRPRSQWQPFIDLHDTFETIVYGVDYTGSPGYQYDLTGFMTAMGDLDGNGRDELFIAAPFADGPDNSIPDCGEIYVVFDSDAGAPTSETSPAPVRPIHLTNFPNPFNTSTTFRLSAPQGESVSLTVYDTRGREIAHLLAHTPMIGDEQDVVWTAFDQEGRTLPTGIYFVMLRAGKESYARKVLLAR